MKEKVCTRCKELKSYDMFGSHSQTKSGLHSHCRACRAEDARKRKNREMELESKPKINKTYAPKYNEDQRIEFEENSIDLLFAEESSRYGSRGLIW